jgi:malonyl-CoA O-methyltransferase
MKVRNPDFRAKAESIFRKAPFMADLGIELESIEPGSCSTRLRVMPRFLQQDQVVHAAVQAAIADHTAGAAAASLIEPDQTVLTVEYKINLLRPAVGQLLRATAQVIRSGRTLIVVESEVRALGVGESEALTAKAMVTLAVVKLESAGPEPALLLSAKEGYDRWSEIYDQDDNPLPALEEPEVDALLGDVRGLDLADIGCGTGRHAVRLAARGARVTAVDFSEGMLERARKKAETLSSAPRFVLHDLTDSLPLADQAFDRVLSALVIDHIEDLGRFFAELRRICRPQGRVVLSVIHPAMMLRGVQARFRDPKSGREIHPRSAPHQLGEYVQAATAARLSIEHCREHAVDEALAARVPRAKKYLGWPMLLVMSMRPMEGR